MTIPVLIIPVLNRYDLLVRIVGSIDYPVETLAIVNNGKWDKLRNYFDQTAYVNDFAYSMPFANLGVAPSWNYGIRSFPNADYWLIVGNDVIFGEGDLEKIHQFVSANLGNYGIFHAHSNNCFAITPHCVNTVGLFDENFYPAYLEDTDYNRRCDLAGVKRCNIPDLSILHGDPPDAEGTHGSRTINSDPHLARENGRTHGNNFDYYRGKWGGMPGHEQFALPYGAYPLSYWRFDLSRQIKQQWSNNDAIDA